MKKSIYFTLLLLFTTFLIFAQTDNEPKEPTDGFDLMSGLIGLVVGAALGYFGSKMMGNKES